MLTNIPWLSIITYVPLAGALVLIFLFPKDRPGPIKYFATLVAGLDFAISLPLWFVFQRGKPGYQFEERVSWIPSLGVDYRFGIDGISLVLILLTTFIGFIAVYCSYTAIKERQKEYYVLLLLLQTFMIGTFCCLDFFLFYVFWEIMLVPMYFLIGVWGGERRLYAAIKFFLYTLAGSVLMLLGIIALYFYNTSGFLGYKGLGHAATFSVETLTAVASGMPAELQIWLFFAFFFGFAIKVPMFPFHTWLPDAHTEAPTAGSVILAGVLLKMGTYGFLRFCLPLFPHASLAYAPWIFLLAVIGIIYGAWVSTVQPDIKKLVAYSSVSHLGFVVLGIFTLTSQGLVGGIIQMVNHGLSTGGLFLVVGMLYERRHTRLIAEFGGLWKTLPALSALFLIVCLSSLGLPGLNGFVGEFLILLGAFQVDRTLAVFATTGIIFAAVYLLWMYQRVFFGVITKEANRRLPDLSAREWAVLLPILLVIVWIGVYPASFTGMTEASVEALIAQVQAKAAAPPAALPVPAVVGR